MIFFCFLGTIFSSIGILPRKKDADFFKTMLVERHGEELSTYFFESIKKIENNFQKRIGCFQEKIEWEEFLTDRKVFTDDSLQIKINQRKIKKITQLDAKAVALYNLYSNIVRAIDEKENKIGFHEEFASESLSFFNFIDEQENSFFKQNNYRTEVLSKDEIDFSAGLLAGLLKENGFIGMYNQYEEAREYYDKNCLFSYNCWKHVAVFCDRYPDKGLKYIKKENQNFFRKNDKWLIAGLIIFSLSLYLLIKNQKLLLVSLF